jgi:Lysozyme like domain
MADLTFSQLEGYAQAAGFTGALIPLMAAIALAESGGNPEALNATDNGGRQSSFGLWQISNGTHTPPSTTWADPSENASLAYAKYQDQGLGAWGTYTTGAYETYLQQGVAPTPPGDAPSIPKVDASGGSWVSALGSVFYDLTGGLLSFPAEIIGTFSDVDHWIGDFFNAAALFFRPSTYVRIGAGLFGLAFIIAGIVFLGKEAQA